MLVFDINIEYSEILGCILVLSRHFAPAKHFGVGAEFVNGVHPKGLKLASGLRLQVSSRIFTILLVILFVNLLVIHLDA